MNKVSSWGGLKCQGFGIGRVSSRMLVRYAFNMEFEKVIWRAEEGNVGSVKCAIGLGFRETEGREEKVVDGIVGKMIRFELRRGDDVSMEQSAP